MDLKGQILDGRYRLDRRVGRGGMGMVYTAEQLSLGRTVAIKLLEVDEADEEGARRFLYEGKAAARIDHENVITIHEAGEADGYLFIVMEMLEGLDLARHLRRATELLPVEEAVTINKAVCEGVQAAHELGIIHRDLKPSNVFLAKKGARSVVKVLDFGIATAVDPKQAPLHTQTDALVGTYPYMPPELVNSTGGSRRDRRNPRSDVYSIGVIAYQMLTGRRPYEGDLFAVLSQIVNVPPPPWSKLMKDDLDEKRAALEPVVRWALAKDPEDRPETPVAFARALAMAAEGRGGPPVIVTSQSPLSRPDTAPAKTVSLLSEEVLPADTARFVTNTQTLSVSDGQVSKRWIPGLGVALIVIGVLFIGVKWDHLKQTGVESPPPGGLVDVTARPSMDFPAASSEPVVFDSKTVLQEPMMMAAPPPSKADDKSMMMAAPPPALQEGGKSTMAAKPSTSRTKRSTKRKSGRSTRSKKRSISKSRSR